MEVKSVNPLPVPELGADEKTAWCVCRAPPRHRLQWTSRSAHSNLVFYDGYVDARGRPQHHHHYNHEPSHDHVSAVRPPGGMDCPERGADGGHLGRW